MRTKPRDFTAVSTVHSTRSLLRYLRGVLLAGLFWAVPGGPAPAEPGAAEDVHAVSRTTPWRERVTWEGRLSTPEADCIADGLVLAPWGVYPTGSKGVVVWCVTPEIYGGLGATPWELWSPVQAQSAEGYCHAWHDAGLLHEEADGRFWCEDAESPPEPDRAPNRGNA